MDLLRIERQGTSLCALHQPGEGTPIVFVPGVMSDARGWQPVADAMDTRRPVYIVNRRGRQPSGPLGDEYDIETEVQDLLAWLSEIDGDVTLFGWSYGASIGFEVATRSGLIRDIVAYEPVLGPFGVEQLAALHAAVDRGDLDDAVTIINRDVSQFGQAYVDQLRTTPGWTELLSLAAPIANELTALNNFRPGPWSELSIPITLILGELSRGAEPYGTAFDRVHVPEQLGRLVSDQLRDDA